jgi:hypothetical protein
MGWSVYYLIVTMYKQKDASTLLIRAETSFVCIQFTIYNPVGGLFANDKRIPPFEELFLPVAVIYHVAVIIPHP